MRVFAANRHYLYPINLEGSLYIYLVQIYLWHTTIAILEEGIVVILTHTLHRILRCVYIYGMDGRIINEIKRSHIVDTANMILMLMSQQNGRNMANTLT